MADEVEQLFSKCQSKQHLYIYGAGKNACDTYYFLNEHDFQITGFLVSNVCNNPHTLFNCPVLDINNFFDDSLYLILVPMFRNTGAYREIYDCLVLKQIHNIYFFSVNLLLLIKDFNLRRKRGLLNTGNYYLGENIPVETDYEILVMKAKYDQEYHWRFPQKMFCERNFNSIYDFFSSKSALEEFESQYGTYHVLPDKCSIDTKTENTFSVYMAQSHLDKTALPDILPFWIIPIQVGAALADKDICEIRDNIGDHISERNGNYSECTALYWMWKNAPKTDFIGLCHYRRHFYVNNETMKSLPACNIDVLVTTPTFVQETVGTFFSTLIPKSDINIMLESIEKLYPEYFTYAREFLEARFYPPCNLFIMKYDLFQKYMDFVFSITFEIEKHYNDLNFYRSDRYIGFLIECLLGIFLMYHKDTLKIAYTDMLFYS